MIKNPQKQSGSVHAVMAIILAAAVVALLGFVFWQNFVQQEPTPGISKNEETIESEEIYSKDKAIIETSDIVTKSACSGAGASFVTKDYRTVKSTEEYTGLNGTSIIDEDLTYAVVLHGCGTGGAASYMKRTNSQWFIIAEAASYPPCIPLREELFPTSMVDQCYPTDRGTEPENVY